MKATDANIYLDIHVDAELSSEYITCMRDYFLSHLQESEPVPDKDESAPKDIVDEILDTDAPYDDLPFPPENRQRRKSK